MSEIPRPISEWTKDGWMSDKAPASYDIQASATNGRHQRLVDFVFHGEGWYPKHRVLVTSVGDDRFELRFYAQDPRPAFAALAAIEEHGDDE